MISIIDYGAGNLRSISNALKNVGAEIEIVQDVLDPGADAIVLPGVGNFGDIMEKIAPIKQDLLDSLDSGTPFLGICLGLQVLFEGSEEASGIEGLSLLNGSCLRFKEAKVPHMGWNQIKNMDGPLFDGINDKDNFYFVHSYYGPLVKETSAVCNYGIDFSAAIQKDNLYATQFHPERSGTSGLKILENFLKEIRK